MRPTAFSDGDSVQLGSQSVVIGVYEIKGEFKDTFAQDPKEKAFRVDYRQLVDD